MTTSQERSPYGHRRGPALDGRSREGRKDGIRPEQGSYQGETYYGRPAIKASHYGWLIVTYFFIGGIAGASQIVATIADLWGGTGDRAAVRSGRYLALAGALASPAFLIADLHTPRRWYNMLRIFRPTSSMSIGSWTLATFGAFTGLAALGQAIGDITDGRVPPAESRVRDASPQAGGSGLGTSLTRLVGLPAAAAGAMMSIYTGMLLATTSVPLWASTPRLLPALFGTSAMATATAAMSLVLTVARAPAEVRGRLERLALLVSGVELVLATAIERHWRGRGVAAPLERWPIGSAYYLGVLGLGTSAPFVLHAVHLVAPRRWTSLPVLAALSTLAGGYILRAVLVFAGNDSARRPQDYFRFSRPATEAERGDTASVVPAAGAVRGNQA